MFPKEEKKDNKKWAVAGGGKKEGCRDRARCAIDGWMIGLHRPNLSVR
jgi:hypothetical protein